MLTDEKFIKKLFDIAEVLDNDFRYKIVAAVVYKNKIISIGYCELKTHSFQKQYAKNEHSIYWHAETRAIHSASKLLTKRQFKKCTLYVCRGKIENNKCVHGNSKPCTGCESAIADFEIPRVVYSNTTYYDYEIMEK